jgi:Phospholipase_D-nuclease N-terminal
MSARMGVQRIAEGLIRASCRRLPEDVRAERFREWSAELPAILDDESVRPGFMRSLRALGYAAGIAATTRRLSPPAGRPQRAAASGWRDGAIRVRPTNLAVRATAGVAVWLIVVSTVMLVLRTFGHHNVWPFVVVLALAGGFAAFCLADIARSQTVRYLPKWAWALVCVAQIPSGGIVYLSVGRVSRSGALPSGPAQ